MTRSVYIYKAIHTATNTAYVGSTFDPPKRWRAHVEGRGANCTRKWIRGLIPDLPNFRVIDSCDEADRILVESAWIAHYGIKLRYEMVNGYWRVWPHDVDASKRGGQNAQATLKREGKTIYDPEIQRKAGRAGAAVTRREKKGSFFNPAIHRKVAAMGGRAAQVTLRSKQLGAYYDPKVRQENLRKAHATMRRESIGVYSGIGRMHVPNALHNRWHVKRGIFKGTCANCLLDAALNNLMREEAEEQSSARS